MDAGSLYLRIFFGAKPFESAEMDSLARRMNVSGKMSENAGQRYFLAKGNVSALSIGNKLLFGARYYAKLTERQRLAVAAHEFGHLLGRDGEDRRKRVVAPAAFLSLVFSTSSFAMSRSVLLLEFTLIAVFLLSTSFFSMVYSRRYHKQEMLSDELAASFVDGEALVEAIRTAESLAAEMKKRLRFPDLGVRRHPKTRVRVEVIKDRGKAA
jgi:hypothetical protein